MIPHDLVYYRPGSIDEALEAFSQAAVEGMEPAYFGGGTEVVTSIRDGRAAPRALIDLRGVLETQGIGEDGGEIRYGASVSLGTVCRDERFPLLARAASGVADHSVRNTITLGGNVVGRLPYRETVLPFLVAGGRAEIRGPAGGRMLPLERGFDRRLPLARGEILVALRVPRAGAMDPWFIAYPVDTG